MKNKKTSMKKSIRTAIVGCGIILPYHAIPVSRIEGVELVAVCDINRQSLLKATQTYRCNGFEDFGQMLNEIPIDTLHICTPNHLHFPMYMEAMERGINVLIEKPVAIKRKELKKIVSISKHSRTIDAGIFQNRFTRSSKLIKNALDKKMLGAIKHCEINISSNRQSSGSWRGKKFYAGGGILIDLVIHYVDLVRWFLNKEPIASKVFNKGSSENNDIEDIMEGIIFFDNDISVDFNIKNSHFEDDKISIKIECAHGTAYLVGDNAKLCFKNGTEIEDGFKEKDFFVYSKNGKRYWGMGHLEQINNYYNSIKLKTKPAVDLLDACKSVEIILDIYNQI